MKWFKRISILCAVVCAIVFLSVFAIFSMERSLRMDKKALGEKAVKLMYDFGTIYQLDEQMSSLKRITTEPVFNQLTIDNEDRTLTTYFKFKNESVTVNIIKSTDSYVLYSLDTIHISSERRFVFFYSVNDAGLIDWVREVEAIDFIDYFEVTE